MESVKDRLPSSKLIQYRKSFRTCITRVLPGSLPRTYLDNGELILQDEILKSDDPFFIWLLSDFMAFADGLKKPWIMKHGDSHFFNSLPFTTLESSFIKKNGLNVFLYEPVFVTDRAGNWPCADFGNAHFVELENIRRLKNDNGFPTVSVFLCEHGLGDYLRAKGLFSDLEFYDFSTLLMHEGLFSSHHPWPTYPPEQIDKKIISLNFRYEPSREMLAAFLRGSAFYNDCLLSFYHRHDAAEFVKRLPFEARRLKNWSVIQDGLTAMRDELPYTLDVTSPALENPVGGSLPDIHGHNQRDYARLRQNIVPCSFVHAYSESRPFSPCSEISEKTIHPLLGMKPFVVFAAPGFLKQLRRLGFRTFQDQWSEDYDQIEEPRQRFDAFLDTVGFIGSQTIATLREWARDMQPTLAHNRLWMLQNIIPNEKARVQREMKRLRWFQ